MRRYLQLVDRGCPSVQSQRKNRGAEWDEVGGGGAAQDGGQQGGDQVRQVRLGGEVQVRVVEE